MRCESYRDNRCMHMAHACLYICCNGGLWECLLCNTVVKDSGVLSLGVYVVCLFKGCDGCCVIQCI